jgi:hypothetical protein
MEARNVLQRINSPGLDETNERYGLYYRFVDPWQVGTKEREGGREGGREGDVLQRIKSPGLDETDDSLFLYYRFVDPWQVPSPSFPLSFPP